MSPQQMRTREAPSAGARTGYDTTAALDGGAGRPVMPPPGVEVGMSAIPVTGFGRPRTDAMAARFEETVAGEARPLVHPDARATEQAMRTVEAGGSATGVWTQNVMVDALWCMDQPRNAHLHVKGGAWKKIHNGSDAAFTALAALASQARQTGRPITFREEADGMVHEIYLW
ncbi:hypothetical protein OG562_39290 [Streptomyces sp. NBC_01275]|uniref:hypothetical protein n=1 Tax=Streptomyces sp. NBC_01275 TaxID=2903807 RepID=UPI0022514B0A|nr:hypothetical protein [Streptomyces sp. NBC_01275]MCX4766912.1 hypothetical protein [Streptomyces sp. NBC_01275]